MRQRIQRLLAAVPDPETSSRYLERLRDQNAEAFRKISASPAALRYFITLASYSSFLSEAVLRHPEWLLEIAAGGDMYRVLSAEEFAERLDEPPDALDLARLRRRQLLRIVLRDVLELASLPEVTAEISNLADAILDAAARRVRAEFAQRHGEPRLSDGRSCGFAVLALSKLGGQELNYSSDIDLMFLYEGNGETGGPERISNKEFFKKVANDYTALLSTYTPQGMCYRVDLRLRPEGRYGDVCTSLEGAKSYYQNRARDWEKQMLIKARPCAGDRPVAQALLDYVEPLIYSSSLDFRAVEAVSETRQRISEKRRNSRGLDVKLARGGIRDIEFLVQCLQRLHGGRDPWVRHGGTLLALFRLRDKNFLAPSEHGRLASAYQFLRHLEHRLQFADDRQTHTLPSDPKAMELLARKMPGGQLRTAEDMCRCLNEHLRAVQELYERVIYAQKPVYYTPVEVHAMESEVPQRVATTNVTRFLDHRAPRLAATLSRLRIVRGRDRLDHYLEKALANGDLLARLDADSVLVERLVDLLEHSQYYSNELLRHPELLEELRGGEAPLTEPLETRSALRRFFRRQMLRIQADSLFEATAIFTTLERTSDLVDRMIAIAYRIALADVSTPENGDSREGERMMVIALGRLGMREFDLASDADLVFVLPDSDPDKLLFWTGLAERMIDILSAYTGEGVMFTVDTRLRPNGREGNLVQTESSVKSYFANRAEAWEGIAYMKARGVAGDVERATAFLNELQKVDWRRWGQSRASRKELAQMRARLEKEQGGRNPLKAGQGGYYDIDFALMYLRLKGAGIFYKVLNTPERIDVIEQMGHLEPEDAEFLRDAATFYRALDHGMRLSSGHTSGKLPTSHAQFDVLTELVQRWTPERLHDQPLDIELSQIRARTREFYAKLFA